MGAQLPSAGYANYALFVLLLVYVSNQWSRYLLNYLYAVSYEDMTPEDADKYSISYSTGISTSQYGLLVGFGFSFVFVLMGMVMGRAADLYNRKMIIFIGLLIWNVGVTIQGFAANFAQLLLGRIILGVGESFSAPASYSLIADFFPIESRAKANGIFAFGVYVGGGLGSMSIAMALGMGWRGATFIVAIFGFILAGVVLSTIKEPQRSAGDKASTKSQSSSDDEKVSVVEAFNEIFSSSLVVTIFIASSIRFMGGYAIGSYMAVFFADSYPEYNTIYSYLNASVVACGGAASSFFGGWAADEWEKSGQRNARVWIPAIGAIASLPFMMMCVLSGNFYLSMAGLFFEYLFAECWFGPIMSVLQSALSPRVRGIGIAAYTFTTTMLGSLMSYVMGVIFDARVSQGANEISIIKSELLYGVFGSYIIAAALFYHCHRYLGPAGSSENTPLIAKKKLDDVSEPMAADA